MEAIGNGCKLDEVLHSGNLSMLNGQIGIEQVDAQEVCKYLSLLKDHPLVKDMELALESKDEYQIIRPFGSDKGSGAEELPKDAYVCLVRSPCWNHDGEKPTTRENTEPPKAIIAKSEECSPQ